MNCNKAYNSYKDWWLDQYWQESFEEHVNSMSLYDFMETMNSWDVE
jgi:hypothetical protein